MNGNYFALYVYTVVYGRGLCLQVMQKLVEIIFCIKCIYCSLRKRLMFAGYVETYVVLVWSLLMVEHKFFLSFVLIG